MSYKEGYELIVFDTPLALEEVTAPTIVEDDTIKLYAKDLAGVSALYYMGDDEVEHQLTDGYPTGTGVSGRVAFWTGATVLSSDSAFLWDSTNNFLGIGGTTPLVALHIQPSVAAAQELRLWSGGTNQSKLTLGSTVEIGVLGKTSAAGDISSASTAHGQIVLMSTADLFIAAKSASGIIKFTTQATDTVKFQIGNAGQLGIGGATYGGSGDIFSSGGASAQPTWVTRATLNAALDHGLLTGLTDEDHPASAITIANLNSSTINQIQEMIDHTGSAGWHDGGVVSASGTPGAIDVTAGNGFIRATDDDDAPLLSFTFGPFTAQAIPSDTVRYIFVNYHATTPTLSLSADEFEEAENKILIGVAVNEGGTVNHAVNVGVRRGKEIGQIGRFLRRVLSISRDVRRGGLALGETGARKITLTAGRLWWGRTEYTITALNTGVSGSFETYHYNGVAWVETDSVTDWPNTQYNDITSGLVTMTNNRWANLWFYILANDKVRMVYGREQFTTQSLAELEAVPNTLPNEIATLGVLVARLTFQKSAATSTIASAFAQTFSQTGSTNHATLSNLAWNASAHTGTASNLASFDGAGAATFTAPAAVTAASTKITLAGSPSVAGLAAFSIDVNQANLDHGSIGGLADDDHTQYVLRNILTTLGDLPYGGVAAAWTRLAGNITTTRKFLRETGDGALATAPTWDTVLAADVPSSAVTAASTKITLAGSPSTAALAAFSIDVNQANLDHGSIGGLADDDHALYLLASDATSRALFATNWLDLTDSGATTLHSHAGGGGLSQAQVLARVSLRG